MISPISLFRHRKSRTNRGGKKTFGKKKDGAWGTPIPRSSCEDCKMAGKQPSRMCHEEGCIQLISLIDPYHKVMGKKSHSARTALRDWIQIMYLRNTEKRKRMYFIVFWRAHAYPDATIEKNKHIKLTLPNGEPRGVYVDFVIETADFIIYIELDEHQHKFGNYDTPCEVEFDLWSLRKQRFKPISGR